MQRTQKEYYSYFELDQLGLVQDDFHCHKFHTCDAERSFLVMIEPSAAIDSCCFISIYNKINGGYTRISFDRCYTDYIGEPNGYVNYLVNIPIVKYPLKKMLRVYKIYKMQL